MKRNIFLFMILVSTLSFSQSKTEDLLLKKIFEYTVENGNNRLYLQCDKPKTSFISAIFSERSALKVPRRVLKELEKNAKESQKSIWNLELFVNPIKARYLIEKKCLNQEDVSKLIGRAKENDVILSISNPVFDDSEENCVVSVRFIKSTTYEFGYTFFIKKVYGVWTIIDKYDYWMS